MKPVLGGCQGETPFGGRVGGAANSDQKSLGKHFGSLVLPFDSNEARSARAKKTRSHSPAQKNVAPNQPQNDVHKKFEDKS